MNRKDTVLIVEDEDILRDLLSLMFEENGFKVLAAVDGIDALEVFTAHKDEIGVVLSDIGLPRLGGWETFLKMREIDPELKVILASGFYNTGVKEELLKAGAKNFIQKPYNTKEVITMLREMLE